MPRGAFVENRDPRFVFDFQVLNNRLHERIIDRLWLAVGEKIASLLNLGQVRPDIAVANLFQISLVCRVERNAKELVQSGANRRIPAERVIQETAGYFVEPARSKRSMRVSK